MDRDGRRETVSPLRRRLCVGVGAALAGARPPVRAQAALRVGLTPVFLDDQVGFLNQWRQWLEAKLERNVEFVKRGSYRDVVDLVRSGRLDFAWICGYPYVRYQRALTLVATPRWRGGPHYRAYIIVPNDDAHSQRLLDLRGKVFAYSDPDSNSGCLFPRYRLAVLGENPSMFFGRTFFTWAHRKVVEAVGAGLADGGAVDGYVWETLSELAPQITGRTRILEQSPPLGHPPFVARADIAPAEVERFRAVLLGMTDDPVGAGLLRRLHLDGFMATTPALYDDIARMAKRVQPV